MSRKEMQEKKQSDDATLLNAKAYEQKKKGASLCETHPVGRVGFELSAEKTLQDTVNNKVALNTPKHQSGPKVHYRVHINSLSPELKQIIEVWPKLPEHIKEVIMALVKTKKS